MGELPDKENGKQGDGGPLDGAAGRSPANQRRHGAGKRTNKCGHGGEALQRRVNADICNGSEQRERAGDEIGASDQPE